MACKSLALSLVMEWMFCFWWAIYDFFFSWSKTKNYEWLAFVDFPDLHWFLFIFFFAVNQSGLNMNLISVEMLCFCLFFSKFSTYVTFIYSVTYTCGSLSFEFYFSEKVFFFFFCFGKPMSFSCTYQTGALGSVCSVVNVFVVRC